MLAKTFIDSFCKRDIFILNPNKPTGLTLPMSDVANHLYPQHHHHQNQNVTNHSSSLSSTSSSFNRLNRWLSPTRRRQRRRNRLFKNLDVTLQNECILEVDEDRLIDADDEHDEIINVVDCIKDHQYHKHLSSSNDDDDDDNENHHHHHLPQEFYIRLTEKNCQLLSLYRSILEPYVQAYWFVADRIANHYQNSDSTESATKLMNNSKCINHQQQHSNVKNHNNKPIIMDNDIINIDEKIFLKMLISSAKQMAHNGYIYYGKNAKKTPREFFIFFMPEYLKITRIEKTVQSLVTHSLSLSNLFLWKIMN